jgi:hypothetical protein
VAAVAPAGEPRVVLPGQGVVMSVEDRNHGPRG